MKLWRPFYDKKLGSFYSLKPDLSDLGDDYLRAALRERDRAVEAWHGYYVRFRSHPRSCIGFGFPGHEKFPVDKAMVEDILAWGEK